MSIKIENDAVFLDTGVLLISLGGKDKIGFKEEDGHLFIYVEAGQHVYVNHRLYYNSTDHQVKMELME